MNKILSVLILIVVLQSSLSESRIYPKIWRLTVVDSATLKGIERVTVSIVGSNIFFTDVNGAVDIYKNFIHQEDIIKVSCVGYKTILIKPNGRYPDTIMLSPSFNMLKEINVKYKSKKIILGDIGKIDKGGYLNSPSEEIAEYIPNNQHIIGTIISLEFCYYSGR